MSHASNNLRYLRKKKGFTQEEFAQHLNIKRSLLGAYEEERADPKFEVLERVCEIFGLNLDDMMRKDLSTEGNDYLSKRRQMKMLTESRSIIHFVPMKAAAGYLAGYADSEFLDELNTFTLPMLGSGFYRAFEIVGDSMLPTPSGSIIVGEKLENLDTVKPQNAYIILSKTEGLVYKRIQKNAKLKNKLTLVSDNPAYKPYQINEEDVLELWQAQVVISKVATQQRWDVNTLATLVNQLQDQVSSLKKGTN